MVKKGIVRYFWLGYFVPYVFLAMNEDAVRGTLWFYLITIAAFSLMTAAAVKCGSKYMIILGNTASCLISLVLTAIFQTEKWLWYFKPFGPYSLLLTLSAVLLALQLLYYRAAIIKNRGKR